MAVAVDVVVVAAAVAVEAAGSEPPHWHPAVICVSWTVELLGLLVRDHRASAWSVAAGAGAHPAAASGRRDCYFGIAAAAAFAVAGMHLSVGRSAAGTRASTLG